MPQDATSYLDDRSSILKSLMVYPNKESLSVPKAYNAQEHSRSGKHKQNCQTLPPEKCNINIKDCSMLLHDLQYLKRHGDIADARVVSQQLLTMVEVALPKLVYQLLL